MLEGQGGVGQEKPAGDVLVPADHVAGALGGEPQRAAELARNADGVVEEFAQIVGLECGPGLIEDEDSAPAGAQLGEHAGREVGEQQRLVVDRGDIEMLNRAVAEGLVVWVENAGQADAVVPGK